MAELKLMRRLFEDKSQALTTVVIGSNIIAAVVALIIFGIALRQWM
jgi:hypothetical protein